MELQCADRSLVFMYEAFKEDPHGHCFEDAAGYFFTFDEVLRLWDGDTTCTELSGSRVSLAQLSSIVQSKVAQEVFTARGGELVEDAGKGLPSTPRQGDVEDHRHVRRATRGE